MDSVLKKETIESSIEELAFSMDILCVKEYNTNIPWNYNPKDEQTYYSTSIKKKCEDDGYDSDYAHWRTD